MAAQLEKQREEEKVHQFLMGLDEVSFRTTRSNILATDPLRSLNRVYATMVQEERVKVIAKTMEERGMVVGLMLQIGTKGKGCGDHGESSLTFSNCWKSGHDAKGCFQIIGYPEWWGDRPRFGEKNHGRSRGHGKEAVVQKNMAQAVNDSSSNKGGRTGLTNERWETLMTMLNAPKQNDTEKMTGKNDWDLWIIDSGASNYMTGNLSSLCQLQVSKAVQ